jgi:7-cyano-7-deazaguanine synthase
MKTVLIYSGGLDSTVLLYHLYREGVETLALGFNYGQRHLRELAAGHSICNAIGVPYRVVSLERVADVVFDGSCNSQTDPDVSVPDGHYEDETMRQTVVPNRNMIMLSLATAYAISQGAERVAYGAHAGDHAIYPDCRIPFMEAMAEAMRQCDYEGVSLFARITKEAIVRAGAQLNAPMGQTWSCYKGRDVHCGTCGTCVERREAFALAGVADETVYAEAPRMMRCPS